MKRSEDSFVKLLDQKIGLAGSGIIEIGCGDGRYTAEFAQRNPRLLYGIDPHAFNIRRAKARAIPHARFERGSLIDLPVGGGVFDIAVFSLSLHKVPVNMMETALDEAVRVLRWNSHVVILEPGFKGSFFDAERELGINGGDKTFAKRAAMRAMRTHPAIAHVGETIEEATFELTTIPEFLHATKPTVDTAVALEFLRTRGFRLTAECRINIYKVL